MSQKLSDKIDRLLRQGKDKKKVWRELKDSENRQELTFILNDLPTLPRRQKFLLANLVLAAILVIITCLKIFDAVAIGSPNLYFFLALVVPVINIYVLKKILRFRRVGYLYLFVLSILALFQPQNHHFLEITILVIMTFLSGFLYVKMFPKDEVIRPPEEGEK